MRVGIYGGTFDPIHKGHIEMALAARGQFALNETHFVPSKLHPTKEQTVLDAESRYKLVQKIVDDLNKSSSGFKASRIELDREGTSYSYLTVQDYLKEYKEIFWIVGFDAFMNLHAWEKSDYLKENTQFIVCPRHGKIDDLQKQVSDYCEEHGIKAQLLNRGLIHISSSLIRELLSTGESIHGLVPESIFDDVYKLYSSLK